ncbi:glycosyltransferase [Micromonospora pisi]|uniref:glycosyltransferase n=1 Tax=Micromonospora pisi TaxID=589240 RepID=UPI000EAFE9C0|nr:glycosyltransferase [Micromonospora pisi]
MRAVHFTDTYLPRRDGVVSSIRTLVRALADRGHPGLTVVPRHPGQTGEPDLMRLRALPCGVADLRLSPWLLHGGAAAGTIAEIAASAPEVVHVHTPGPVGLLGVLTARRLGLPLVQTYHTDLHAYVDAYKVPTRALRGAVRLYAHRLGVPRPPVRPEPAPGGAAPSRQAPAASHRRAALDATNLLLLGDADAVVVPTRAVLDRISLPVPDDRVFLVPTGVAPCRTSPTEVAAFRAGNGIAPTDKVILFVGRVNREKGVDLLINSFAELLAGCPRARLVLVGAIYEPRWLAELLRLVGPAVADRITVIGQQPPPVVAAAYGAAEVLAFPSGTDTQALVLQEAALAGVPAVLVDPVLHRHGPLAGAADCAAPTTTGFAAALLRLLTDPAAARRLGQLAADRAAGHTPERYADAICDVYAHAARRHAQVARRQAEWAGRPGPAQPVGAFGRLSDRGRTRR